jgi:hypothetical protein
MGGLATQLGVAWPPPANENRLWSLSSLILSVVFLKRQRRAQLELSIQPLNSRQQLLVFTLRSRFSLYLVEQRNLLIFTI